MDVTDLWFSKEYADFEIIAKEEKFKCHRNILGTQSSVLQQIMKPGNVATMIEEFTRFFYVGKLHNDENAEELFKLAMEYNVVSLKAVAEDALLRKTTRRNAIDVLTLGCTHNREQLKSRAFEEI